MPWNEFLLPVLAGYIFINLFNLTRFRAQKHDGYRLLIESLFYGVVIFAGARFLALLLHRNYYVATGEQWLQDNGLLYPLAGTALLAALMALFLALFGKWIFRNERAKQFLVKRHDNGFLRLFHRALTEARMVSVTMSNRKVYIGYVLRTPNLSPEEQFVGLLPVLSGYRDKDTLRLNIVTNYGPAIKAGTTPAEDFEVTFALSSIDSASLFDPNAYPLFDSDPVKGHKQDAPADPPRLPPPEES